MIRVKIYVAICCMIIPFFAVNFGSEIERGEPKILQQPVTQQVACFWQFAGDTENIAVAQSATGASATRDGNWIKTAYTHAGNEGCSSPTLFTTHTWTQPASRLTPGQSINLNVSASWELSGAASCTSLSTGLHTYIMAGTTTVTTRRSSIILSKEPSGATANSGSWVVPSGSKIGATMAITANANAAVAGGTVTYNYRYVCQTPTPTITRTATKGTITPPTHTPTITLTHTPTITLTPVWKPPLCEGKARDSGARFSDFSGEVTIAPCSDPADLQPAEMDMVLETGSIIKTESDSSAILSFADMTTFIMKPFTTVYLDIPPDSDSKLSLLFGKVWANVKHMAKYGTMNVTMNQAVAGTKGTTFVLEETGQVSTLKVLDGTVSFTSRATGKSIDVKAGQSISASAAGLSAIVPFDIAQETALWPETQAINQQKQPVATLSNEDGSDLSTWANWLFVICAASLLLLALVGLIAFIVHSKKRKSTPNSPYRPY